MKLSYTLNKNFIFIFLFIFLNQSCAYLINVDYVKFLNIAINDWILLFDIAVFILLCLKGYKLPTPKYNFKSCIIMMLFISVISSIMAFVNFGQPFMLGFRSHRTILIAFFMYFPIYKLMYNGKIKKEEVMNAIKLYIVFSLCLYFIQFFLSKNKIYFLKVYIGTRYGNDRFYFDPLLMIFYYLYSLNEILNNKRASKKTFLICIFILLEILIVQNYRLAFLGLGVVTLIGVLFSNITKLKKISFILLIFVMGLVFAFFTQTGRDLTNIVFNGGLFSQSTMNIRSSGKRYYLNELKGHYLLGKGYPNNSNYEYAKVVTGAQYQYYLADNGIVGFFFIYGFVGIFWFLFTINKIYNYGRKLKKNKMQISYVLFVYYLLVVCINEIHWYWGTGPFVILLVFVLENIELNELNISKKGVKA